jgi:poly(A) polymerase
LVVRHSADTHHITNKQVCSKARKILTGLDKAKFEAYLVGGAVRDLLLDKTPKDFDIATNAHPEQVKKVFGKYCRLIGRRFRLAHVHFGREYLEVATFRAPHDDNNEDNPSGKVAEGGRIIHDNVYGTLEQDALRRDFTINALFYCQKTGDVLDHVNGMTDIEERQLRLIGDPETRYREDPVRMLRAIRFSVKLGFSIEPKTEQPIYKLGHLLKDIAPARLFDETLKMFHGGHALETFRALRQFDLFQYLFPLTEHSLNIEKDDLFLNFIEIALRNTDKRINSGKSTTPAFLFSVLLWDKLNQHFEYHREEGQPAYQAMHKAASDVFTEQVKSVAVPRRFSNVSRDIWMLQVRFTRKDCRSALSFTEHRRFRAAYDFFCLRAEAGYLPKEECEWWTTFQFLPQDEQQEMCKDIPNPKKKRRRRRKK